MIIALKVLRTALIVVAALLALPVAAVLAGEEKRPLSLQDVMKFRQIRAPVISEDGAWIACEIKPNRGDGVVEVHAVNEGIKYIIERGSRPRISRDGRWVFATLLPEAVELEKKKKNEEKTKSGLATLDLSTGEVTRIEKVKSYSISRDSLWVAYLQYREKKKEENKADKPKTAEPEVKAKEKEAPKAKVEAAEKTAAKTVAKTGEKQTEEKSGEPKPPEKEKEKAENKKKKKRTKEDRGRLVLRQVATGEECSFDSVVLFSFDPESRVLVYVAADDEGAEHHIAYRDLEDRGKSGGTLARVDDGRFTSLAWVKEKGRLAFLQSIADEEGKTKKASVWTWDTPDRKPVEAVSPGDAPKGWFLPTKNSLRWSRDGERLFFGFKPEDPEAEEDDEEDEDEEIDLFDTKTLLDKSKVDVWHWNDPFIMPHQKKRWPSEKDRTYRAVYHRKSKKAVPLADRDVPRVYQSENPCYAAGTTDIPYQKDVTWDGFYNDLYVVDLENGTHRKVATRVQGYGYGGPALSPDGRFLVFYDLGHWHLVDCKTGERRNLTEGLEVPFANEDHDYPSAPYGYGVGGWTENDAAVLIYDKFDIWQFPTGDGESFRITQGEGRQEKWIYRILRLDRDQLFFQDGERLLLSAFNDRCKVKRFAEAHIGALGVKRLLGGKKRHDFITKAKEADNILFRRQSYTEFPDLWVAGSHFDSTRKVTNANPQIAEFAWGSAELVEWETPDEIPLQGVLIKPGNYEEGKRFPVLVYFYRLFSQRLYDFHRVALDMGPCLPYYSSDGYAIFLPDVRFEIGHPGRSATKCLVSSVEKLIELGIADPGAIALHGHSWSGYQTAFVVTQTHMFKAAVAGAPVSNMTSAYSGIRLGSGLARQWQYEKSQSRIGGTLWDALDLYIENSPVFFVDKIETPLLVMFGDADGAVPWQQGIELYLAMRRHGKDCIFLQYRDESHVLRKLPNKLDYTIKMKEFLDFHVKGAKAPKWIKEGVPYKGK